LHSKNGLSSARKRTRAREIPKSCKQEFPKIARNHWKKSHLMLAFLPELTGSLEPEYSREKKAISISINIVDHSLTILIEFICFL